MECSETREVKDIEYRFVMRRTTIETAGIKRDRGGGGGKEEEREKERKLERERRRRQFRKLVWANAGRARRAMNFKSGYASRGTDLTEFIQISIVSRPSSRVRAGRAISQPSRGRARAL